MQTKVHYVRAWQELKQLTGLNWPTVLRVEYLKVHPYCFFCGRKLTPKTATLDHLLAKSVYKGIVKPKVLACKPCNILKASRELDEFLIYIHENNLVKNKRKANYHFYKLCPQNLIEYVENLKQPGIRSNPGISVL